MEKFEQLISDLVSINSVNPDLINGAPGEAQIAHFIAQWLERNGLDVQVINSVSGRPNVVGIAHGLGGGRTLLLNGHMDTVGTGRMAHPLEPVTKEGRLSGRGSYDMKGGLAACMVTVAEASRLNLSGDVIFAAVVDEENASLGTQELIKHIHADGAIVAEFTELQLVLAHRGFALFEIETLGQAAHGSRPDLGTDAIVKMGKFLVELEKLDQDLRSHLTHPLLGSGSVHASLIHGGNEVSTYPDQCVLTVERRTIPGESPEKVESELSEIIEKIQQSDSSFRAMIRRGFDRSPMETPEESGIVKAVQSAAIKLLNHSLPISGVSYWSDAALLSSVGIPSVLLGPSGSGAHADEEWVDLSSVKMCADIYLATAKEFCS